MTPTPVGMRCPECARERTKVTRGVAAPGRGDAPATYVLIALNVAAYLAEIAGGSGGLSPGNSSIIFDFGLYGPSVADGEWYRLLTGGFLHASLIHIGFNMFALYFLGRILEPGIGTPRFVALYFASLLAGSFGAVLLSPDALTIGASGAVFGIFGATFVIARSRRIEGLAGSIGVILLLNLVITFGRPEISIGGHLGGLAAGLLCAAVIVAGERGMLGPRPIAAELGTIAAIGFFALTAAITVA
ncbi:MAG: rhomboid family intramembrane serine protease [Solirubrobacterales bacterium]